MRRYFLRTLMALLAGIGAFTLALAALLARPVSSPPPLEQTLRSALAIDSAPTELLRFTARDGTSLAYRLYPAADGSKDRFAVVIHGTAGHSRSMTAVGKALAAAGVTAATIDVRGHGASGARGDISYIGQLDDDLADLLAELKWPAKPALVGHSGGGGFSLRIARGPMTNEFSRYVLTAPYLGRDAASTREQVGGARWVDVDIPRIVALTILHRAGLACCESLPVLAFGVKPGTEKYVTSQYSFRLMSNFGPPDQRYRDFSTLSAPLVIIAGVEDEQMRAEAYAQIAQTGATTRAVLVPGADHMGILREKAGLDAIVAAVRGETKP